MTKSAINRTWIAGLVVFAAGIVAIIVGGLMIAGYGGTFSGLGTSAVSFAPSYDSFFWGMVTVVVIGAILAAIGGIVQLAAWIGALVNSYMLPEKTWFLVLLLGGLLGFAFGLIGFAAMIAYVVAAPDGMQYRHPTPPLQQPRPLAPTT